MQISDRALKEARKIKMGQPTKYDSDLHIPLLLEIFMHGGDVCDFCNAAEICKQTYYEWLKVNPDFKAASDRAYDLAETWWKEKALLGISETSFNSNLWSIIMRNRFDYTDTRKLRLKGLDPNADVTEQAKQLMQVGEYPADQALYAPEVSAMTVVCSTIMSFDETLVKR